jgi:hypothetical protein
MKQVNEFAQALGCMVSVCQLTKRPNKRDAELGRNSALLLAAAQWLDGMWT